VVFDNVWVSAGVLDDNVSMTDDTSSARNPTPATPDGSTAPDVARLQAEVGELRAEAARLRAQVAALTAPPPTGEVVPAPDTTRRGALPEIIGYIGAAFIVGAGLTLASQTWALWPKPVQLGVVTLGAIALYVTALIVTTTAGGLNSLRDHATRRRLVGVLLAVAIPLVVSALVVALEWAGVDIDAEGTYWPIGLASMALVAAAVAAWWAPGAVPTLSVAVTGLLWLWLVTDRILGSWEQPLVIAIVSAVYTVGWLIIAPRLLPPRLLTEALGVTAFIGLQLGNAFTTFASSLPDDSGQQQLMWAMWFSRIALLIFALVAVVIFARGGSWVWAAGGVIAAGAGALSIAGQTLGMVAGLFVAGVILLAVSGAILIARTRRTAETATSDPAR